MACYTIIAPLRSSMMITTEAPEGSSREEIWESVTRDDLAEADTEICWDDVKDSWCYVEIDDLTVEDEEGDEVLD